MSSCRVSKQVLASPVGIATVVWLLGPISENKSYPSKTGSRPLSRSTLYNTCVLHLQWIPSHVNLKYNDIADSLAKEGTTMTQAHVEPLTYLELYSRRKALVNISWRHPPAHSWYRCEGPGAAIRFKGVRGDQTALTRLSSGHLKPLRFSRGDKKFNICSKCNMIQATPQHLLDCVALLYDDLLKRPDFVLEVMRANDLMDLI
ncbi:hypothetical protein AVEN_95949-1 [Araneus ventricosus]|uniref:RNase H type-1 domain-containing protein n=1 Tax=Araneus ventricosus TaxID=182803 RepID=A0A4Y2JYN4_ARAVE|nr:hypothetical protein AVEN_95949-1 [Araneus ventricosus]